ncbi:MAG: NAD(P)/FAD-dependent oxidoreductase, partial [Elusimicrobia bacterium]|nr:NAD(P)/FAD-dependent oxidoreductase [Elusimicrobiota bacterium]
MKGPEWDAVVIGGGPAGLTAGMYLARAGRRVLLIERGRLGGRAFGLGLIENYPGFPAGISGRRLMRRFTTQARRWGLAVRRGLALHIERRGDGMIVSSEKGGIHARAVLVCTGTRFVEIPEAPSGGRVGHGAFE